MSVGVVKRIAHVHIEWKIPKFFDRIFEDNDLTSPFFSFNGKEWYVEIEIDGYDNVHLVLVKSEDSADPIQVSVTLGIKRKDDSVFKCYDTSRLFTSEDYLWHAPKFSLFELIQSQELVAPNGVLVVFLTAFILNSSPGSAAIGTACQGNGHTTPDGFATLSNDFKELLVNGSGGDVTFIVKDKKFSAHQLVLAARSAVFRSMFEADMVQKNNSAVDILDVDPDQFEKFLLYMYSGDLKVVSRSNAFGLYLLADKYNLKELKKTCCGCLACDINLDSFCDVILLAYLHGETELLEIATRFFIIYANVIIPTPKWTSLMAEHSSLATELLVKMTNKLFK